MRLPSGYWFSESFWESEGLFFYEHYAAWSQHGPEDWDSIPKYGALAWDVPAEASYRVALGRGGTVTERPEVPAAEELMTRLASDKSQKSFWRWSWGGTGVGQWFRQGWVIESTPDRAAWESVVHGSEEVIQESSVILLALESVERVWQVASTLCSSEPPTLSSLLNPGELLVGVNLAADHGIGELDGLLIASTTPIQRPPQLPPPTPSL
jgi:hypothetical protein